MIGSKTHEEWAAISRDPVQVLRSLADWIGDILTVMRVVSSAAGMAGLADSRPATAYYHAERARHWLVQHVTGGLTSTDITPELVGQWVATAADRNQALTRLADELADVLVILNTVSGSGAGYGLWTLGSGAEGSPYWHAGRAHMYVLALLVGNVDDGHVMHTLWSDNQESTAYNLGILNQHKRSNSIVVTIAPDGDTATVTTPGGGTCYAGRTAESGLFWVTAADSDDVIGHEPSWAGIGHVVAGYYNYPTDTRLIIEYPPDIETAPAPGAATADSALSALSALSTTLDTGDTATDAEPGEIVPGEIVRRAIPGVSSGQGVPVSAAAVTAAIGQAVHTGTDTTGTAGTAGTNGR